MIRRFGIALGWSLIAGLLLSQLAAAGLPVVAIIIDDLGYRYSDGRRATRLPGPVACAVIPHSPHSVAMATEAHALGKEILLHLPMQPLDPERPVGTEGINIDTTRGGVSRVLNDSMRTVPHVSGVNNHMGSLITQHPGHMTWLMQALHREALFFVDSVTSESSVALSMAVEQGVPATRRDIFLDREDMTETQVTRRLKALLRLARRQGHALAIGHPFPATMAVLERELPDFEQYGVRLVSVSELIALRNASQRSAAVVAVERPSAHPSQQPEF